jgi:hypothetical protein
VGWAIDDDAVVVVRIFVDSRYVTSFPVDEKRPDVAKAYPGYAAKGDGFGWHGTLELPATVSAGDHRLLVQAVDSHGLTRDIGVVSIVVD